MSSDIASSLAGILSTNVSWEIICVNIKTIAFHWFEKKKYEIRWVANHTDIITEEEFIEFLLTEFENGYKNIYNNVKDFENYKQYVLSIADKCLDFCFHLYIKLLEKNHSMAWKYLSKILYKRSWQWITQHTYSLRINGEDVFGEAIKRFYEKFQEHNLEFENSYKLKSYFFKVMDFIIKEENRKSFSVSIEGSFEKDQIDYEGYQNNKISEYDDQEYMILKKGIKILNETEKSILHGLFYEEKKLKEIAEELSISEENCRIIKFRALKKLRDLVNKNK